MSAESTLERKVVAYAKLRGALTYKFSSPAHRGVPDRIIIRGGRVLFLELKAPGGKLTALQHREICRLREHGCRADWTYSLERAKLLIDTL